MDLEMKIVITINLSSYIVNLYKLSAIQLKKIIPKLLYIEGVQSVTFFNVLTSQRVL